MRQKLSFCNEKIAQKEAEIETKDRKIAQLKKYKKRVVEADDKAFVAHQKFKQEIRHQRTLNSTEIEKEKQSSQKNLKK